jgi:hypothetical protein
VRVRNGYRADLYWDDQYAGATLAKGASDATLIDDGWVNQVSSLKVRPDGVSGLGGTFLLENRNSQLVMDVAGGSHDDGAAIQQAVATGSEAQQFTLAELGNGLYTITHVASGKSLDIDAVSEDNFAKLQLWGYVGGKNQQFILEATDGGHYKLIAAHSGKILEVGFASTEAGAGVNQYDDNGQRCGEWRLVPLDGDGADAGVGTGDAGVDDGPDDDDSEADEDSGDDDGSGDESSSDDGAGDDDDDDDRDDASGEEEGPARGGRLEGCSTGFTSRPLAAPLGGLSLVLAILLRRRRR